MEIPFLDLKTPHRELKDELLAVVSEALDNAAFVGGQNLTQFESDFAAFTGASDAVGVASGTDALLLALVAMGIGRGSKVITVPNTFIATCEAISQAGAEIAFVDVDPETCLIDPDRLEDFLKEAFAKNAEGSRPAAIIPVHLYGQCADMDAILELAGRYGLKVLEDAAQAHGASYKGRYAGSLADAAAFSFYPGKNLGACGEGGAVTTSDPTIAQKVRMLRDHGQKKKYEHEIEGYNGRLDAIQAGFLNVKLRHLAPWNAQRRAIAERYDDAFGSIAAVRPVKVSADNIPARHLYVIHTERRDALANHLNKMGIGTGLHYPIPLHLQACYESLGYRAGQFPAAEKSAAELISLPLFPGMTDEQTDYVIDGVATFFHKASA